MLLEYYCHQWRQAHFSVSITSVYSRNHQVHSIYTHIFKGLPARVNMTITRSKAVVLNWLSKFFKMAVKNAAGWLAG